MGNRGPDERAVSPVVGVALLLAIIVGLSAVSAGMLLGLSEQPQPSPDVTLSIEAADAPGMYAIVHDAGDELDGDRIELRGAADPDTLDGSDLSAGERGPLYAVDETIDVVWVGDDDTSYVIREFDLESDTDTGRNTLPGSDAETTVPEPDEGCEWVEEESDGGTEEVKIDGLTVNCNVETAENVKVVDGGAVVGDTTTETKVIDASDARFYGDTVVEKVFKLQDGYATGAVTAEEEEVKLDNATVGGTVTGSDTIEVTGGSTVDSDVVGEEAAVKVLDSDVSGSVAAGNVTLNGATVEGDVFVDESEFDCSDSTVNGQGCEEYEPKDPENY